VSPEHVAQSAAVIAAYAAWAVLWVTAPTSAPQHVARDDEGRTLYAEGSRQLNEWMVDGMRYLIDVAYGWLGRALWAAGTWRGRRDERRAAARVVETAARNVEEGRGR
jgi:hypothetical protein